MKILFIVPEILLATPLGVMQLSAICKENQFKTRLMVLKKESIIKVIEEYQPDIIAYSTMTPDAYLFKEADNLVKKWQEKTGKRVVRIMGGPHPTYFPDVFKELDLDAICLGEGDKAIVRIAERVKEGKNLLNIPNVIAGVEEPLNKELITDLDSLPFTDRSLIYEAVPYYRSTGLRSFSTSRGCPYNCTYCYNHIFNSTFKGCGPIIRRRSVDNIIEEIKYVIKNFPPIRYIRFADDTFIHKVDDWFLEFSERYKKEINIPFYCLMRSNTLTEETAKILKETGCRSIGMAVETGNEEVRNKILKRNLSDLLVKKSFELAKKYGLKTYGNTMLAIPGTDIKEDFNSFLFTKKLKLLAPTFGIFSPYPKTKLTEYAIEKGYLDKKINYPKFGLKSVLNCYTEEEKDWQLRLAYMAPLFCDLPDCFIPLFKLILKLKLTKLYSLIGTVYIPYRTYTKIFPGILPRNPVKFIRIVRDAIQYSRPMVEEKIIN